MYFQILKLVLWPRRGGDPRVLSFEPGVVNVISGASKTGKSAVIPIIDYCLGAEKCTIPVGVIREECSWFGVVVETVEGQKLLARREPGDQKSTGDMFVLEGPEVEVPDKIESKNTNVDIVKASLDRLAGLSSVDFETGSERGYKSRVSFRDLAAFMFQPQNIVANPDVLFFKADTNEHREKLKTIFPYVLNAITPRILALRQQKEQLERQLRREEFELKGLQSATEGLVNEGRTWLQRAIELGLSPVQEIPEHWADLVDRLREVVARGVSTLSPTMEGIDATLDRLGQLRTQESDLAAEVTSHRQRLNDLRRLRESSESYGDAMLLQRDRLSISTWLRDRAGEVLDPIVALDGGWRQRLDMLCSTLEEVEVQLGSHPFMSDAMDAEMVRQRGATEDALARLTVLRREKAAYQAASDENERAAERFRSAERFLGALEQIIAQFDRSDSTSPLQAGIEDLKKRIQQLSEEISEHGIKRQLDRAIHTIQGHTSRIVPLMDAEYPDASVRLNVKELTVQVTRGNREDYLWEIGSGANWLAYHVAVTLALQLFFLESKHHPVPWLLVYDQPSQVYFPKRSAQSEGSPDENGWGDQDVQAVRKVFEVLAGVTEKAGSRLQIIVLDHAHSDVWGNIANVRLCEEWRGGEKLVPVAWTKVDGSGGTAS